MIDWKDCPASCEGGRYVIKIKDWPTDADLPVCPACGGLGDCPDLPAAARLIAQVRRGRLAFCPYDQREHFIFPPAPCLRLQALREVHAGLLGLRDLLGEDFPADSYAATLLDRELAPRLATWTSRTDEMTEAWRDGLIAKPEEVRLHAAVEQAMNGQLDDAEAEFLAALAQIAEPSLEVLLHVARFYAEFRRDWRRALPHLERARDLHPLKAEVHLELMAAYDALGAEAAMRLAALDALYCPDLLDHPPLLRARRLMAERLGQRPLRLVKGAKE